MKNKFRNIEQKELRIPFKGKQILISDCPTWYLKWVAENWKEDTDLNKATCKAADEEYQYRKKYE